MLDPSSRRAIEGFIIEKMNKTRMPSLAIAVVSGEKIIYANGFGFSDVESGTPATPKTLYGVGSITKSLTSLAILKLQEMGKLDVADSVEEYVPIKLRPKGGKVRIWHLMTHTTGIPALAYAEALIRGITDGDGTWASIATAEDVIAFMSEAEEWAEGRPGDRFFYLNEGYVLLGYIVEKVSGMSYEDFVRRHILRPAGMKRSYFSREDVERDGGLATPYVVPDKGSPIPSRYPWGIKADGGLISNVEDMARYIMLFLNEGEVDGTRVIRGDLLREAIKPRVNYPFGMFGDERYGYGWFITDSFYGERLVHHGGSLLVYTAWLGFLPERGLGVILLANGSGYPMARLGMYVLSILIGHKPYEEMQVFRLERVLEKISGTYTTYKGTMNLRVYTEGEVAYLERKTKHTKMILPLLFKREERDSYVFSTFSYGRPMEAIFRFEKDGKIVLLFERYKLVKSL